MENNKVQVDYCDLESLVIDGKKIDVIPKVVVPKIKQYNTNLCWFTSLVSFFLYKYYKKGGAKTNLSIGYFLFWMYIDKIERLFYIADKYGDSNVEILYDCINKGIDETGNIHDFKTTILKHGIVCEKDMISNQYAKNPEQINMFLTRYARLQLLEYNKTKDSKIKEDTIRNAFKFLTSCLGNPPEIIRDRKFKRKQVFISPMQFATEIFEDLSNYEQVISIKSDKFNYNTSYTNMFGEATHNLSFDNFKLLVENQKAEDDLVVLGIDCRYGVDYKNKIFRYEPSKYEKILGIKVMPNRDNGFNCNILKINHNLNFVEKCCVDGKIYRICYDNFFDDGVCYMEEEWFDNYVFEAIVNKKYLKGIKTKKELLFYINSNF